MLVVLLPVLVAGRQIASPPTAAEIARLQWAENQPQGHATGSEIGRQFYLAFVADQPWPADVAGQARIVGRARLSQLLAVLGLSLCLYLSVLLARGRLHALLACASLALLPSIAGNGCVLRPEGAAVLFGALGLLLLTCFAGDAMLRLPGRALRRSLSLGGLSLCASVANGLSVAALPTAGECLLVPGVILLLASLQLLLQARRIWLRRGFLRLPIRAINGRLLPWTATALVMPAAALLLLNVAVQGPIENLTASPSPDQGGLLPAGVLGVVTLVLFAIGTVASVVRVGLRFGRGGRIGPELVVFVFAAVFLVATLRTADEDLLPAAAAAAFVLGEGAAALSVLVRSALSRGPVAAAAAARGGRE